jgi:hypothetical protein
MSTKGDFTAEQWQALRNAPQLVALATAAAGNSGLFGSLAEGIAMASSMAEAVRGDTALVREVFATEEIRAAQEQIRALLKSAPDKTKLSMTLQAAAIDGVKAALGALSAKGATADGDAFRKLLAGIGDKVANASTEGSFLGFGGERVSEGERVFLAQLKAAVGGVQA